LRAVLCIKLIRAYQMFLIEQPGIFSGKNFGPYKMPYPVIYVIPDNCCDAEEYDEHFDIERTCGRKCACGEEERVPRQERRYHETGLAEYDYKKNDVS